MKKIILTKGLPASGKSFWSNAFIDSHPGQYKKVNKDILRTMLDNGKWSSGNEKFILQIRDSIVCATLEKGLSVIVDDTNFDPKHEARMREIAKMYGATVQIEDFTLVPLQTCLDRDAKRANSVGAKVIMSMYNKYLKKEPVKAPYDPNLPEAIICDLDGTLSLLNGRNPYDASTCDQDQLNEPVSMVLDMYYRTGGDIILVSGRSDEHRVPTETFLRTHKVPYDVLFMRPKGDSRKDSVVKQEIYDREIKGKYNVKFVIDDRLQVCRMWHENGLFVFNVNQTNEEF